MKDKQALDVTQVDEQKQEWTCPSCRLAISFQLFDCPRCGYDARLFFQRMMIASPGGNRSGGQPKEKRKKRRVSAGFVFGLVVFLGWVASGAMFIATCGTAAMLPPSLMFGFFSLILIARDSRRKKKKRKKAKPAEELTGMAEGMLALAEELAETKSRKGRR